MIEVQICKLPIYGKYWVTDIKVICRNVDALSKRGFS